MISTVETPNERQKLFLKAETRFVGYGGARGGGKAEPLDEPVLTPFGFRKMGDIRVGSTVCTPDGSTAKVIQEHPQGVKPIYKVTFIDGASTRVTAEHLWLVSQTCHEKDFHIADTATLINILKNQPKNSNLLIPLTKPVVFTRARLGIHIKPYTLGALLGDGCLTGKNTVTFTTKDPEIIENVEKDGYKVSVRETAKILNCCILQSREIRKALKTWGLLVKSNSKYIPEGYKYADIETRMELLRGLMDTDGYADSRGHIQYCSVSKRLAEDVQWLIRSIGGKATITSKTGSYLKNGKRILCQTVYMVYVQTPDNGNLFKLTRKKDRCKPVFNGGVSELCRRIVSIEPCGEAECKCITIDKPNGLYITKDFVVTHNSWAVRFKAEILAAQYAGIRMLIVRRTLPELKKNHRDPLMSDLQGLARWKDSDNTFIFTNKSTITLGYCDAEADVLRYQGQEYDIIFIDEATQLTEFQYTNLKYCLRGANDFPKRMYLTCNPGGVGHEWVKRLFIDCEYRNGENPEDYTFIQAKATDNTALKEKDPEFIKMLDELPDGLREMWRDGNWDVFAGQYFSEFNMSLHVIEPLPLPQHWRRYVSMDYGFGDMCAVLWEAVNEKGQVFVYRELYEKNLLPSDAANKIRDLSANEKIEQFIAPPDLFAKMKDGGRSFAEQFGEHGIYLTQGSNRRVDGWVAIKEYIKLVDTPDGGKTSNLKIFTTCRNLIRCLPKLQYDTVKMNGDVLNEPHEVTHAPDALRYFCISHTSPAHPLPGESYRAQFRYEPTHRDEPSAIGYGDKVDII